VSLSHSEIWDDSALVRSWNDAVAEYEYYHSVHARGEDIDEVLRQAEREEEDGRDASWEGDEGDEEGMRDGGDGGKSAESADEGEIEDDDLTRGSTIERDPVASSQRAENSARVNGNGKPGLASTVPDAPTYTVPPPPLLSNPAPTDGAPETVPTYVSAPLTATASTPKPLPSPAPHTSTNPTANIDTAQTLENIKMAYYWAGYYSGLYDGQRQPQAETQGQGQGQTRHGG